MSNLYSKLSDDKKYDAVDFVLYWNEPNVMVELLVPGYQASNIKIRIAKAGTAFGNSPSTHDRLLVTAGPDKEIGKGTFCKGFYNEFPLQNGEHYNYGKLTSSLVRGVLTIAIPVKGKFTPQEFTVSEG